MNILASLLAPDTIGPISDFVKTLAANMSRQTELLDRMQGELIGLRRELRERDERTTPPIVGGNP